jgi:hypothetical protein
MLLAIERGQARKGDYDTGGGTCSKNKSPITSRSKNLPCGCVAAEPPVLETVWVTNVTWVVVVVGPDVGELGVVMEVEPDVGELGELAVEPGLAVAVVGS